MKRRIVHTIRVDDVEDELITKLAKEMRCSKSEVWRRMLSTVAIIWNRDITLSEALKDEKRFSPLFKVLKNKDIPLVEALKPLDELAEIIKRKSYFV